MNLKPRVVYNKIYTRNLGLVVWNGGDGVIGIREKFGESYLDTEYFRNHPGANSAQINDAVEYALVPDNVEISEDSVGLYDWLKALEEVYGSAEAEV